MEEILLGVTDRTILVFIPDSASTDGSGKTGLAHTSITVSYTRVETDNDVVVTDATSSLNALTNLTDDHNDWGWKEVSSSLAPGLYRLDVADAVFASGAWYAIVYVMVTTSEAAATPKAFRLVAVNALDAVRGGMTALPNAAADAPGGLVISDAGGFDIDNRAPAAAAITNLNTVFNTDFATAYNTTTDGWNVNATHWGGTAVASANVLIDGAITANKIDAAAITNGKFAADAISAAIVAADVTTEIQNGLATAAELAKVPKSDSNVTWNATAAAQIQSEATDALNAYDPPTNAEMEARTLAAASYATAANQVTIAGYLDTEIAAILAAVDTEIATIITNVATLQTSVDDVPTNAELTTALGDLPTNSELATALTTSLTTALTEGYRGTGATGSVRDLLYEIIAHMGESSIASTTKTLKKLDGSTTAKTYTLDSATTPTSITEAT